jgi:hypothetical protein
MASFDFTSVVLDEGMTFVFSFGICVTNSLGGFNNHLADSRELETSVATQRSHLDKFVNNLDEMLLSNLAREIEEESVLDAISTHATPGLLGSHSIRFGEGHTRLVFGLRNAAPFYKESLQLESLSDLEEDLD